MSLTQSGAHQVPNAAAAAAMAVAAGVDLHHCARALTAAVAASRWRMELHERADGLVVVNDAYNANPASMAAALDALVSIGRSRGARTVAVLGEMLELGAAHEEEHVGVGRYAARCGVDVVVAVGEPAAGIARGASRRTGLAAEWRSPRRAVTRHWRGYARMLRLPTPARCVVLVKASRGAALESVAEGLLQIDEEEGSR